MKRVCSFLGALLAISCADAQPPLQPTLVASAATSPSQGDTAAQQDTVSEEGVVRYFDRRIPLRDMLQGFPYRHFEPDVKNGEMFFIEKGTKDVLRRVSLGAGPLQLAGAPAASDADWSKRSLWFTRHPQGSPVAWLHADAGNDERMNVWSLDLKTKALTAVTDHDYAYAFGFDEKHERFAYLPRQGTKAPYTTCLHIYELASAKDTRIVCDKPSLSFTWGRPQFTPDGKAVLFDAMIDGDRTKGQLVKVGLSKAMPKVEIVTDTKPTRRAPRMLKGWLDGKRALFRANDDGYWNLYSYVLSSGAIKQLTRFKEDMTSAALTDDGVVAVHRTPKGSTLVLVDVTSGKTLAQDKLPGRADILDGHGHTAILQHGSPDIVFEAWSIDTRGGKLARRKVIAVEPKREAAIIGCKATAVTIPTFDRELHAFLLEPRKPLADPKQRLALVRSFYGGRNAYTLYDQILCATGFTVLSPAVRGTYGFGKAFEALNDKDLGGKEIIDLFHVAKWLEQRTGLPPQRIGVYGRSHGGYAAMRAMTFPKKTPGHVDRYPFGFGLSDAGFSDIKTFYDKTNIPDWVVLESGDPNVPAELARMNERSAVRYVERLQAPILLTHGEKDWRVPTDESRRFAKAADKLGRPVTYVEFPGQGHKIQGLDGQTKAWQVRLAFLQRVAAAAP
jgi:dipeptidyl aminopeptidase/acylaminoacyl peptidase